MGDMSQRHLWLAAPLALAAALGVWAWTQSASATALELPTRLSSEELWALSERFSEPGGYFRSDNLVSNELTFQHVIPELKRVVGPGGVYFGVGPDQNFTYIAALRPKMAFITDIRRDNLLLHLMYKALFELSDDRADFLSRLVSRPRPDGLDEATDAGSLFAAYAGVRPDRELFERTLEAVAERLVGHHGFPLSSADLAAIEHVLGSFYGSGPGLSYSSRGGFSARRYPSYEDLQIATDADGTPHAYMASEDAFRAVRALQQNNLVVPVVGDFGGPKALRAIGRYVRERGAVIGALYTSNVEQYLFQERSWFAFAENVATMPVDESSTFIRSCFNQCATSFGSRSVTLLDSIPGLMRDVADGRITSYWAVLNHSR